MNNKGRKSHIETAVTRSCKANSAIEAKLLNLIAQLSRAKILAQMSYPSRSHVEPVSSAQSAPAIRVSDPLIVCTAFQLLQRLLDWARV
jgi:hypothetical protein